VLTKTMIAAVATLSFCATPLEAQESVRRGWNAMNGWPYNLCSWIVVSGPETLRRNALEQAKKTYSEPDPARLAKIEGRIFVEIRTAAEQRQGCSNRTMSEIIFVDKRSDKPAFRLPVESREFAMQNGFGATW